MSDNVATDAEKNDAQNYTRTLLVPPAGIGMGSAIAAVRAPSGLTATPSFSRTSA